MAHRTSAQSAAQSPPNQRSRIRTTEGIPAGSSIAGRMYLASGIGWQFLPRRWADNKPTGTPITVERTIPHNQKQNWQHDKSCRVFVWKEAARCQRRLYHYSSAELRFCKRCWKTNVYYVSIASFSELQLRRSDKECDDGILRLFDIW